MQPFRFATDSRNSSERCAGELLACVPAIMRFIRHEMRSHRNHRLSVPQFRALIFASVRDGPSLSAMAEHLGLSLPTASRMADQLVRRGLLNRRQGTHDRRRVSLSPTRKGRAAYEAAHRATRAALARQFDTIAVDERILISRAMKTLSRIFGTASSRENTYGSPRSRSFAPGGLK